MGKVAYSGIPLSAILGGAFRSRDAMDNKPSKPIIAALLEPLPALTQGQNDLADESVVRLLVRGFIDLSLAAFQEVLHKGLSEDDAIDGINRQATALNSVFLGTSGISNVVTHPWNSPEQLGAFLKDTVALDFPEDDCVRAMLIHLATQLMHALRLPDEDRNEEVEALTLDAADLLLGRAPQDDDEIDIDISM
jgi:HD-like signal output (HDOD) protein